MASRRIALPNDTLSLSAALADRLLEKGSPDAAFLYLYLLRHEGYYDPEEAAKRLQWSRARLDGVMVQLGELGISTGEPKPIFTPEIPKKEDAPDYTGEDVAAALGDKESEFPVLLGEVEGLLGKKLSLLDTKTLLELYDHLGLPSEVLVLLVSWQCGEYQRKYGEGRKPPMSYVRSAAYRWKKSGVDTLEAADTYLKKLDYYHSQEGELLNALSIRGREATASERNYLSQWLEWGFQVPAVALAYDRTVTNTGGMKWSYCNAILRSWHREGRHTLEEIQAAEPKRRSSPRSRNALQPQQPPTPQEQQAQAQRLQENQRWMEEYLKGKQP